jgi:hypothetical protein
LFGKGGRREGEEERKKRDLIIFKSNQETMRNE